LVPAFKAIECPHQKELRKIQERTSGRWNDMNIMKKLVASGKATSGDLEPPTTVTALAGHTIELLL
jgi:hypothetical protein